MLSCNVLFSYSVQGLVREMANYLRNNGSEQALEKFKSAFINKKGLSTNVRYKYNDLDSDGETLKAIKDFMASFDDVMRSLTTRKPEFASQLNNLKSKVLEALQVDLDEHSSGSTPENDTDIEAKTTYEIQDVNYADLEAHYADLYGTGAYNIIRQIEESFGDNISSITFFNVITGQPVLQTNTLLNKSIIELKSNYFKSMIDYLKSVDSDKYGKLRDTIFDEDDKFVGADYYEGLKAFYDHIKHNENLKSDLEAQSSNYLNNAHKDDALRIYKQIVSELFKNEQFKNRATNKYKSTLLLNKVQNSLYEADHFQSHYYDVKKWAEKLNLLDTKIEDTTIKDLFKQIESSNSTLLDATKAYTSLIHFDELLVKSIGDMVSIKQGQKGYEFGDTSKYSYKQETEHQKKSWQQSESIESERFAANLTKQTLNQIRVFNYKTGQFQNRRTDVTSVIVAARNLIDDIVYGKLSTRSLFKSEAQRQAAIELVNLLTDLHSDPVINFSRALQLLFGKLEGANSATRLVDNITPSSSIDTTAYDLSTLYSLYQVLYNQDNPNSVEYNELKNLNSANGPIQMLTNEIASLVARNVTMHYTETTYDADGLPIVKVKKRYFNNLDAYKHRLRINQRVNNATPKEVEARQNKYNFEVTQGTDSKFTYTINFSNTKVVVESPNILSKNAGIRYLQDNGLFDNLSKIDLVEFKQKIANGEVLKPIEQNLYNVLEFIDTQLDMNILNEQGLQQLEIFNQLNNSNIKDLMSLAIKVAYINNLKYRANQKNQSLLDFIDSDDNVLSYYYRNDTKHRVFKTRFGQLQIVPVTFDTEVINNWSDAYSILTGQASKSTTKNNEGDNIPNNSVNKLGTNIHHYLLQQRGTAADSLYFVQNRGTIKSTQHDLEVVSKWGVKKQAKNFGQRELFYHSIFNKFWGQYVNTNTFLIQPTCYSDKTTFINYEIDSKLFNNTDIVKDSDFKKAIVEQTIKTIGQSYKNIYQKSADRLTAIANQYNTNNGTNYTYKQVLDLLTEPEIIQLAKQAGVALRLDLDYRKVGKHLGVNEILEYYATELYNSPKELSKFLDGQKIIFLQSMLDNDCQYQVLTNGETVETYTGILPTDRKSKTPIISTILKLFENDYNGRVNFFKNWVDEKTGRLILAKQGTKNIIGYEKVSGDVELNPLLDKFFYIEGFLSNNLRMSLTGNECNHPDKARNTLFNKVRNAESAEDVEELNATDAQLKALQQFFDENKIDNVGKLKDITAPVGLVKLVSKIYHDSINTIANTAQGTQFKRNVIIPATLQYCTPNQFNGIPSKVKVAVIRDEEAPVYNYKGQHEKSIDSADGSAQINPFQSILENMALGSQAVGFIKKPIWHSYDAETGSAFLAKFATDTITNESMRASLNSHTNLFNLFRKMTNLKWDDSVDLMQSIIFGQVDNAIAAQRYWNNCLLNNTDDTKENQLYYKDKYGDIIQIVGFNKTVTADGQSFYYTNEAPIINGIAGSAHKVYHIFEGNKHLTFDSYQQAQEYVKSNPEAHTIKSLFELHTALGSINCVDSKGNYSEFNNLIVANFMNNVGYKKPDAKSSKLSQANYVQPLKQYHIGYALNNTAVKNGAQNINQSSAWYDESDLSYFEVNSDGLGMQMNADHDIINSELTEFSQVITATSAYGYTYNQTSEIFQGLGRASLASTKILQKATESFLKDTDNPEQAQSDLYDVIGRIVMTSASIKDRESLQGIIMEAVSKVFYKSKNHNDDAAKIPFSDPNIYSDFIATITSTINKEAIKRKHPGSGCVMVPAYHMMQYFEIGGQKLMFSDILKKAQQNYKDKLINLLKTHKDYNADNNAIGAFFINGTSTKNLEQEVARLKIDNPYKSNTQDTTTYNKELVKQYLVERQAEMPVMDDKSWFMPSDNVRIIDNNGIAHSYSLDSIDAYYKFKDGINDIEIANNVSIKVDYKKGTYTITDANNKCTLSKNTDGKWIVNNSALSAVAAQIAGEVILPDGTTVVGQPIAKFTYQEDITMPHDLRPSLIRWQDANTGQYMNIFDSPVIKNAYTNPSSVTENHQSLVQKELNLINEGQYHDKDGNLCLIKSGTLENNAAELIMSNIYKEKFGIEGESLSEILEQGESYFQKKLNRLSIPNNPNYDIAFAKDTGQTTLISLKPIGNNPYVQQKEWNKNQLYTTADGKIKVTRGGKELFTIGRWVDTNNVTCIKNSENSYDFVDANGMVLDKSKYRLKDESDLTSVQERVDYVKQYDFTTKFVDKQGRVLYRNNPMYELADLDTIKLGTDNNENDAAKQRAAIIADIYMADNYKLAQINVYKNFTNGGIKNLSSALAFIFTNNFIDNDMKELLHSQLDELEPSDFKQLKSKDKSQVEEAKKKLKENIANGKKAYKELFSKFLQKSAHKRYVSFLDSQNFIAARIPAQSLQSFMTMKNIAWTENSKNVSYVSHFQTYLQGSDYRH